MLTLASAEGGIGNLLVKPLVALITVQAAAESLPPVEFYSAWHGMYFSALRSLGLKVNEPVASHESPMIWQS